MKIVRMTAVKKTSCRLCLKNITDKGFQVIDSVTRDILDILLLKLKFCGEAKEIICNSCRRKLEFKSTCLNTNKTIIPHLNCEKLIKIDLGEVYIKENGSGGLTDIFPNHKICPLCMQLINGEIRSIDEEELEAIHKFVPEMYVKIIKNPILCKPCCDSLSTHSAFFKDCLEVEQSITDIFESSTTESRRNMVPSEFLIKNEDTDKESQFNEAEMTIKTECVDIKSENDEEEGDMLLLHCNNVASENGDCKDVEEECKYIWKHKNILEKCGMKTRKKSNLAFDKFKSNSPLFKCNKCIYETASKRRLRAHCVKHKDVSEVYKCETCEFETKHKTSLRRHILRHKEPSEVQMYRCNDCDYEAKYKFKINYHARKHKNPSQMQMYKCDACDYESRYKDNFTKHRLTHKDPSEVRMYECSECDYKAKYNSSLLCHIVQHKDPSQLKFYRCNDCDYKTIHKRNINYHARKHKDSSQVQIYKCDACEYESRYKGNFTKHQLKHKDSSEVQMYKYIKCNCQI